jgi:nitrite reductase/ring-hydroxylating ferredoxin subunit
MLAERCTRREFLECGCLALALGLPSGDFFALPMVGAAGRASGRERIYPIPTSDCVSVDREAQVILVRYEGRMSAFALSCPHQMAAIRWVEKDGRFRCTKHDSRFGPEGTRLSGVAPRNLDRYAIRREADTVVVDLDSSFHSDKDPAGWDSAIVGV